MRDLNDASVFRERGPPARAAAELYDGYGLRKGRDRAPGRQQPRASARAARRGAWGDRSRRAVGGPTKALLMCRDHGVSPAARCACGQRGRWSPLAPGERSAWRGPGAARRLAVARRDGRSRRRGRLLEASPSILGRAGDAGATAAVGDSGERRSRTHVRVRGSIDSFHASTSRQAAASRIDRPPLRRGRHQSQTPASTPSSIMAEAQVGAQDSLRPGGPRADRRGRHQPANGGQDWLSRS